ncbi:MAG: hypothetical protein F4Z75_09190 [Synechococcus sp. SB0668_bin_15]|nr:hypothetical protein [Synechococcus sp. SB0668_bin_15]MXZ82688.1 hypothetical protein [Synechococcus sp. SB0666_bin_14]MYA91356.1 hypothetical protein [Synechococcus sp. SB0663_bin_10]MYC48734.1 hypothetical protein [Synechococcus sp. SB0662_bin_14]MYG47052.1 hypothetical protein [Synechococcus sp. SB0675_bin_6]MYJ60223.1 hypothetical protein [Synechococcus sp. SB0672_bin_6]MYK91079.1 hypothetical protein [Synechococcus sp. SB0669_bin_8]
MRAGMEEVGTQGAARWTGLQHDSGEFCGDARQTVPRLGHHQGRGGGTAGADDRCAGSPRPRAPTTR